MKSTLDIVIEHFTQDVFNVLDLFSIFVSLIGVALFIFFLAKSVNFKEKYDDIVTPLPSPVPEDYDSVASYAALKESMESIANSSVTYLRVSGINTLLIALRVLKFMRGSPRMTALYATLYESAANTMSLLAILLLVGSDGVRHR